MKTRTYKTADGKTVKLQIPETDTERKKVKEKMKAGAVSDRHGFAYEGRRK